ncbi:hypothetical protein HMPREF9123_1769 [Neisseria bacilliformis ATCC BAA-1200]|uniref:Uncharacterized protein n=1 Tax=Neisseria bacilliformis ATCC BAA-1200 TaxID=888742 RepID=F2BDG3_9NEIS|nr:hypothetical protein HMPREF9123_1769 [Neisseria bacilliformis ATCC BAA-1200]
MCGAATHAVSPPQPSPAKQTKRPSENTDETRATAFSDGLRPKVGCTAQATHTVFPATAVCPIKKTKGRLKNENSLFRRPLNLR